MQSRFQYVGSASNDLVKVATGCGILMSRCADLDQAIDTSPARVAGYHQAVYGLPPEAAPLLFEFGDNTLVATTKLSQFVTGRYGPSPAWAVIWRRLLCWLQPESDTTSDLGTGGGPGLHPGCGLAR